MPTASELEQALHFPLGERLPEPGRCLEVAPGVRWLRMALPFALDHINLWLLDDELDGRRGVTIVDCGIADDDTRWRWEQIFAHVLQGAPVLRVVVTHMHPDHIGLADWLCQRWSTPQHECRLWISATDWHAAHLASRSTTAFGGDTAAAFFARHGLVDAAQQAQVRERRNYYAGMVPKVPLRYRRMQGGQALRIGGRRWECIAGYGHAPEHIALHCAELGVLISGDMVLPRISTNVSVIDLEPEADPLRLYLDSLHAMQGLPGRTLVLPSHGRPFVGLHTRIGQLQMHHEERLADTLAFCREAPRSAHDLLPVLFKRALDLHQTTFAMGEAVAHLHLLAAEGRLRAQAGPDGVIRFEARA
jgi:glyoxylase-like metal-dependent hydrolase (beta-lactamase superfamily II)